MSETPTDEALALLAQKGDERAFAELLERYTGKLLRYARKMLPRENNPGDIVQDVFITVYRNIEDFDATRRFSPWIYRIAHNAFIDAYRKKIKDPMPVFDWDRILPHLAHEGTPESEKEKEEIRVLLEKGLDDIPPAYKEIIDLYYFEDFSYKEISDILHIPLGTVGIRLSRARGALKNKISKEYL